MRFPTEDVRVNRALRSCMVIAAVCIAVVCGDGDGLCFMAELLACDLACVSAVPCIIGNGDDSGTEEEQA